MSKTLTTAVHLTDDAGVVHSFLPGATVPAWAEERITNPKAWAESVPAEPHLSSLEAPSDAVTTTPATTPAVPKGNASTEAWRVYADQQGFEVDEDATRADIIHALEANGIPTK